MFAGGEFPFSGEREDTHVNSETFIHIYAARWCYVGWRKTEQVRRLMRTGASLDQVVRECFPEAQTHRQMEGAEMYHGGGRCLLVLHRKYQGTPYCTIWRSNRKKNFPPNDNLKSLFY